MGNRVFEKVWMGSITNSERTERSVGVCLGVVVG